LVVPGAVPVQLVRVGSDVVGELVQVPGRVDRLLLPGGVPLRELVALAAVEGGRALFDLAPARVEALAGPHAHRLRALQRGFALEDGDARLAGLDVEARHPPRRGHDAARGLDFEGSVAPVTQMEEEAARPESEHDALV